MRDRLSSFLNFVLFSETLIAREGYPIIGTSLLIGLVLCYLGLQFTGIAGTGLIVLAILLVGFNLYFFRDPKRFVPEEASLGDCILAPADGKVVLIQEVHEPLYIKGPAQQLSIFLSPLNVHVNRTPAAGTVEYVRYVPGEYLVAWHPKASEKNERSEIGLRHASGVPILFKQIAGAVARRIVFYLKEGDVVTAGERFGLVKFGSRMDVVVPPGVKILANVGDRVTAGETIIMRLPASPSA